MNEKLVPKERVEQFITMANDAERRGKPVQMPATELRALCEDLLVLRRRLGKTRDKLYEIRHKLADVLAEKVLGEQVDENASVEPANSTPQVSATTQLMPPFMPFKEPP